MSAHQARECTECGEFSHTNLQGPSGPLCERCYQWDLKATQLIPAPNDEWSGRKNPVFARSQKVLVA